jgi:transcriptional regulator with GAF, ATPase, and Fis domain
LTDVFSAGAAIIVPIVIEDKIFGRLIALWSEPQKGFANEAAALALRIADQLAMPSRRHGGSAEVATRAEHAHSDQSGGGFGQKRQHHALSEDGNVRRGQLRLFCFRVNRAPEECWPIFNRGPRAPTNLTSINCGAIPETLLESELFGLRKRSPTRAPDIGKFEEANGGRSFSTK